MTPSLDWARFCRMARAFPVRTALYSLGPVLFALGQLAVSLHYGYSPVAPLALLAAMAAYTWLVTGYHLATFRRRRLASGPSSAHETA
jgi:hypothetical protein